MNDELLFTVRPGAQFNGNLLLIPLTYTGTRPLSGVK